MNTEFVTYKQALELKELGFDEPCFAFFTWKNELKPIKQIEDFFNSIKNSEVNTTYCSAVTPTVSQAFRWFREKHGLHIVINVGIPQDNITHSKKIQYFFNVVKCGKHHKGRFRSIFYTTYEEAELQCLNKLIEIV